MTKDYRVILHLAMGVLLVITTFLAGVCVGYLLYGTPDYFTKLFGN